MLEVRKKDVSPEEWEKALEGLEKGDEYRVTADGSWIEWRDEFADLLVRDRDFIVAIRKVKKIPFPSNNDLANAFRSVGNSMRHNRLNVSENKEAKESQDKAEQSHRQTGSKPPQYQIGIDTFERSKVYYTIYRKDGGYRIKSKDITMGDIGIWINDDLEKDCVNERLFIPYHNINQIVEYTEEIEDCDYKAQEIKDMQFQLNLAKQERDKALAELAAHKAMVQKMKCCRNCELDLTESSICDGCRGGGN